MANSIAPWINDPTQMSPSLNLGLSLLANSNTPGGFGSIFGRSALQAGQNYQQAQMTQQQIQQAQQQTQKTMLDQEVQRQKLAFLNAPGGLAGPQGQQAPPQGAPQAPGVQAPWMPQQTAQAAFDQTAPQGGSPWFAAPSQQDIDSIPIRGMSPDWLARYAVAIENKNPLEAYQNVHKQQLELAQQSLAPKIATLDYLLKSDTPSKYMQADKQLVSAWPQLAAQAGLDPQKDFTDDGVRHALNFARNQLATSVGLPSVAPTNKLVDVQGPLGSLYQRDAVDNKLTQVKGEEPLKDVIGGNGLPTNVRASAAEGKQPFNQSIYGAANMSDQAIQSAADYARTHGGNMPTGFSRSPAIVAKVWDKIATDNAASGDTIGAITARGQALKANGAALTQITKLEDATNQYANTLDKNLDNLVDAYKKAGNAGSPLITKAYRIWQQKGTGDADTAAMVTWLNAVQGEYAKLKSGSLGNAGASVSSMDDAKEVINKSMNQGGIEAVAAAMRAEKENRVAAIGEEKQRLMGTLSMSAPGTSPAASGSTPPPKAGATPSARKVIAGKTYENHGGQWYEVNGA
jgi:hypothetical protein